MSVRNNGRGISLLEMLISVAILSMVMVAISLSIFQTGKFRVKSDELISVRQKSRIVLNLIKQDLKSVVFLNKHTGRRGGAESGVLGLNTKDAETDINQIYMHVHAPSKLIQQFDKITDPEVHEVAYFLVKNEENDFFSLYRSEKFYINPFFEKITLQNRGEILKNKLVRKNIILNDRVISFKAEYLDGKKNDGQENWAGNWDSKSRPTGKKIPEAIKITYTIDTEESESYEENFLINVRQNFGANVQWNI